MMSLVGITTLRSIQAQAEGLELLGSCMSLNREELKRREVFKNALEFPFFFSEGGKGGDGVAATSSPIPWPAASPAPSCKFGVCLGGAKPCSGPGVGSRGQGLVRWASP